MFIWLFFIYQDLQVKNYNKEEGTIELYVGKIVYKGFVDDKSGIIILNATSGLNANFTNEGGANNTYRFLKNIMGMWLFQNIRKNFDKKYTYDEMMQMAMESNCLIPLYQTVLLISQKLCGMFMIVCFL